MNINHRFDLTECLDWLEKIQPQYVCIYFLPEFHSFCSRIVHNLQEIQRNIKFLITINCSSGPETIPFRCQDNQPLDAVIYFGINCLCPARYSKTLPTFFVSLIPDTSDLEYINDCIKEINDSNILLIPDITNAGILSSKYIDKLKINNNKINLAQLMKPDQTNWYFQKDTLNLFKENENFKIQHYPYKFEKNLSHYELVVFIGDCENLELIISCRNVLIINPFKKTSMKLDGAKEFRKRVHLIEKFKNQSKKSIGIVLHNFTYSVSSLLNETRKLCKLIKKEPYFITLNQNDYESRLGNFTQLNSFVLINSCSCDYKISLKLSKYFYPVIFWKEFLIACGQNVIYGEIQWSETKKENENDSEESDNEINCDYMQLIKKDNFHRPESWYGLVTQIGSHPISDIKEGKKGIASSYVNEQELF